MGDRVGRVSLGLLSGVVLAGLVPMLVTLPAHADVFESGGVGVFVGYAFGDVAGVDWGVEAFATHHFSRFDHCFRSSPRSGVGPLVRASMTGLSQLALTAAAHGGGWADSVGIDFELGATVGLQRRRELRTGLHTGLTLEFEVVNGYLRPDWLLDRVALGGGLRASSTLLWPSVSSCPTG